MNNLIIRRASEDDAAEIANVHLSSWRETYYNLLPRDYLDSIHLNFKKKYELWKTVTAKEEQITLVAVCKENGVVGFITGGNGRDSKYSEQLEVFCIYLLKKYHHQKIGFNLLNMFFKNNHHKKFQSAYLWVLKDNPTIKFYERTGAVYKSIDKSDKIAGQAVTEKLFGWDSLEI